MSLLDIRRHVSSRARCFVQRAVSSVLLGIFLLPLLLPLSNSDSTLPACCRRRCCALDHIRRLCGRYTLQIEVPRQVTKHWNRIAEPESISTHPTWGTRGSQAIWNFFWIGEKLQKLRPSSSQVFGRIRRTRKLRRATDFSVTPVCADPR